MHFLFSDSQRASENTGTMQAKESEVKKRLKEFMEQNGLNANRFCLLAGIDATTFATSRMSQDLNIDKLTAIAKAFPDIDIRYILTGEKGAMAGGAKQLPLVPFDAIAGRLAENYADGYAENIVVADSAVRGADFAIRVDGDSMTPRYQSGELLLVRKIDPSFFQWGKVYVLATRQGCVVKRLYPARDDDNAVTCHSDNSENYPDYTVPKEDITGIGIVVGHIGHD